MFLNQVAPSLMSVAQMPTARHPPDEKSELGRFVAVHLDQGTRVRETRLPFLPKRRSVVGTIERR